MKERAATALLREKVRLSQVVAESEAKKCQAAEEEKVALHASINAAMIEERKKEREKVEQKSNLD